MKNIYNISYSRVALLLLPFIIRQKTIIAFMAAFMRPLEIMNEDFGAYRYSIDTSVNSQICYMRAKLNDYFDYYERRIKVRTASLNKDYYLLWQDQANKPNMIYDETQLETFKLYMLNKDWQIGANNADFEIIFPVGYILSNNDRNQVEALVNNNKLASTKYIIING
jgi:hypothetical protein